MRGVGGDESLYRAMLREFATVYRDTPDQLDTWDLDTHRDAIRRLAHDLKGVATMLGARQLAECAAQLEAALERGDDSLADPPLNCVRDQLRLAVNALAEDRRTDGSLPS